MWFPILHSVLWWFARHIADRNRCAVKYLSLVRWVTGRGPFVARQSTAFTAEGGTLATPIAFGIAGVIEIVAVHFLVPWPWLQWALLAASLWGLVAFAAILAHHRMHPHEVTSTTLTLRSSGAVVAAIPIDEIASVKMHRRYGSVTAGIEHGRLTLPTQDGTNVDIALGSAIDAVLPALWAKWRVHGMVTACSVQVDDPAALVASLSRTPNPDRSSSDGH